MTWTKIVLVAAAIPSLTTSEIEFVPTGRTTVATMPVATGAAKSPRNQRYWRVSPSGSDERDPSSTTGALLPFGERNRVGVALGSATGGRFMVSEKMIPFQAERGQGVEQYDPF